MSASFRIHREHGAFELSAICIGDVVPVRARGRLSTCTKSPQNKVHEPALFASVPFLPLPLARQLVARSRLLQLLSRPFSSVVVIGNTLRRLASVLLLRQSQPPHGLALAKAILNWCGLPITTRRSVVSRAQAGKQSARGITQTLRLGVSSVVALGFHEQQSTTGRIPDDGKSTAQSRKSTARDGNNAC